MEFTVKFVPTGGDAAYRSKEAIGLDVLDEARRETGLPHLDPTRVAGARAAFSAWMPVTVLTEAEARASGRFQDSCEARVQVERMSLNPFLVPALSINRAEATGEILEVRPIWRLDLEAVKAAWIEADCPWEWRPDIKDQDEDGD